MEGQGELVRRLTARAVLAVMALGLAALGLGFVLLRLEHAHVAAGEALSPIGQVPGQALAMRPIGWLSLGVVALLFTPVVRMGGMLAEFLVRGERGPALAAGLVTAGLIATIAVGLA